MKIGNISIWMTASEALDLGCTHHGIFFGLIPGFIDPDRMLWVSRSDLLAPVEDFLSAIWSTFRALRGEEPDFMFEIGKPLLINPSE